MQGIRTDLATEAHSLWKKNVGETTKLKGVEAHEENLEGYPLTRVEVLDSEGETALGKPKGTYFTLDVTELWKGKPEQFMKAVSAISKLIESLLPDGSVFVAGLGNPAMTPDALGPKTLEYLFTTRHLKKILPEFREVAALSGGVLATTGLEAAEWVRGVTEHIHPAAVIVVDALAARSLSRLCTSIQIADSGLVPGSGVGNHRMALDKKSLGVPVLSVGVPTVVDVETIVHDVLEESGGNEAPDIPKKGYFVTPDSVDLKIRTLAKLLGYGINIALQPGLEIEDLDALLM